MKRFYTDAIAVPSPGGFAVELDGRAIKSPAKQPVVLPTAGLAAAVAAEWQAQGEEVQPATMILTQMANSAIDMLGTRRAAVVDTVAVFAGADLICYHATHPQDLADRQRQLWLPVITWAEQRFDVKLATTDGIAHVAQSPAMLTAYRQAVETLDNFHLASMHEMAVLMQSITLAFALVEEHLTLDAAWLAARVDEDHQASRWGLDAEAETRANAMKTELAAAKNFYRLLEA